MRMASNGWLVIFCCFVLPTAIPTYVVADAASDAAALAAERQAGLEALAKTPPTAETIPGYVGTSVRQSGYTDTNLSNNDTLPRDPNIRKAEDIMTNLPSVVKIDPAKFPGAIAVQQNPRSVEALDRYLSGQYEGCRQADDGINRVPVDVTCDRWLTSERKYCPLNREVEVKADVHYRCDEWEPNPQFTCTESTRVSCKKNAACPSYKTVQDDMVGSTDIYRTKKVSEFVFEVTEELSKNPPLIKTLDSNGNGTYGPAVKGSWSAVTYRGSWWVSGSAVEHMKRFEITGGSYKACLDISVNGKKVFNGQWRPAQKAGYYRCAYPGSWHNIPRINLLPHLKGSGWINSIYFFFKNHNSGSFHLNYKILVGCCESERRTTCTQ